MSTGEEIKQIKHLYCPEAENPKDHRFNQNEDGHHVDPGG